eukprot:g43268.t1
MPPAALRIRLSRLKYHQSHCRHRYGTPPSKRFVPLRGCDMLQKVQCSALGLVMPSRGRSYESAYIT